MTEVCAESSDEKANLDVCTLCQFVWFDPGEYEGLPDIPEEPDFEERLPQEVRERIALRKVDEIRQQARGKEWGTGTSANIEWWQWVAGVLGMPIEYEARQCRRLPLATWITAALVSITSIVAFHDLQSTVDTLGFVPADVGRYGGLTLLTSFFIHGGLFHLLGNMYFFMVFGDNVEDYLGRLRFVMLLFSATVAGGLLHMAGDPASTVPCIGASGAISGVIAFYALRFPRARLGLLFRFYLYFRWIRMPAYGMFILWLALQCIGIWSQLGGFSNVSSLAHIGGAGAGFTFWLFTRKS
jgi:membrane associated rhomboid family serine protease